MISENIINFAEKNHLSFDVFSDNSKIVLCVQTMVINFSYLLVCFLRIPSADLACLIWPRTFKNNIKIRYRQMYTRKLFFVKIDH